MVTLRRKQPPVGCAEQVGSAQAVFREDRDSDARSQRLHAGGGAGNRFGVVYAVFQTIESGAMSRALRKLGFGFVGPTICYAFMQSAGLVNDHSLSCYRRAELL